MAKLLDDDQVDTGLCSSCSMAVLATWLIRLKIFEKETIQLEMGSTGKPGSRKPTIAFRNG